MENWANLSFPGVKFWCDSEENKYFGCIEVVVGKLEKCNEAGDVVDTWPEYIGDNNSVYDLMGDVKSV